MPIDASLLHSIPRFAGMKKEARIWLSERFSKKRLDRGDTLFNEAEPCEHLHIVHTGCLRVFKSLESGKEITLDLFQPGEAVGEVALIDGSVFPATAIALEPSLVLSCSKAAYFEFIGEFPDAMLAVVRDLSLRLRSLSRRVQELSAGEVESRLAHVILTIGQQKRFSKSAEVFPVQLTRQELASMIGARIETVIRTISKWKKKGIAVTTGNQLNIRKTKMIDRLQELNAETD